MSRERLKRPWGLGEAVGAAGPYIVKLVLGGKPTVFQGEGAMVVGSMAAPHGWRGLTQAAVDAVGVAEL